MCVTINAHFSNISNLYGVTNPYNINIKSTDFTTYFYNEHSKKDYLLTNRYIKYNWRKVYGPKDQCFTNKSLRFTNPQFSNTTKKLWTYHPTLTKKKKKPELPTRVFNNRNDKKNNLSPYARKPKNIEYQWDFFLSNWQST